MINNGNNKRNIKAILGVSFTVLILIYVSSQLYIKQVLLSSPDTIQPTLASTSATTPLKGSIPVQKNTAIDHNDDNKAIDYSLSDSLITADWMKRVGKFSHEERADYLSYDTNTLKSLADSGDIKAMSVLANRYLDEGDSASSWVYAEKGAIYGSIAAPILMAILALPDELTDENQIHDRLFYTIALTKTIAIRGDAELSASRRKFTIEAYNHTFKTSIEFTPADEEKINQQAIKIYDSWQKKRQELGLGEFDNEPPPSVKKWMDLIFPQGK